MEGSVRIIGLFCKDLSKEFTIRQISKLIKKSYAYTNKEVWDLINKEVLNKREIGKSIVCTLNIKNELTKTLLTLYSSLKKQHRDEKLITEFKANDALTAFISNNQLFIISRDKTLFKNFKAKVLTKKEFISSVKEKGLDNIVIYGYEKYWEMIGDIYG